MEKMEGGKQNNEAVIGKQCSYRKFYVLQLLNTNYAAYSPF